MGLRRPGHDAGYEGLFSPHTTWEYIGYGFLSVAFSWTSNHVPGPIAWILQGFVFAVFLTMWHSQWRRKRLLMARTTFGVAKTAPKPAKCLILLVSPYDPRSDALKNSAQAEALIETILNGAPEDARDADYETINLPGSNLRPLIDAISFHADAGELRDVYLITTEDEAQMTKDGTVTPRRGSMPAASLLQHYIRFRYKDRIVVHPKGNTVKSWDYAALAETADSIFRTCGYTSSAVLADITGGNKMMSVALAVACVAPNRNMQYMDSQRDWTGQPVGNGSVPVVVDIDPLFVEP